MRRYRTCAAVLGTVLALLLVSQAPGRAARQKLSDTGISSAVEEEIHFSPAVDLNDVTVRTREGIVTLTGSVPSLLAEERAERLAETVRGVLSVVNQLEVDPRKDRSDWEIEQDAEKALLYDSATESFEVTVSVCEGNATLMGAVDSLQEKVLARKVVAGVRGVRSVGNRIEVDYDRDRPDSEIRKDVQKALRWDALVDHGLIAVDVDGGAVTLTGTVGSAAEVRRARHDAWVSGVREVDVSNLKVEPWAAEEDLRQDKYTELPDVKIGEAVEAALLYDPRVASFEIEAEVAEGVVTLRGTVDHLQAKRAAEHDARNTVGVVSVVNRIKVRPGTPTDDEIEENILQAVERDPALEPYEIDVNVMGGTAYLYGEVDSYYEKGLADELAARAEGVKGVKNFIDVEVPSPLAYDPYTYDYYPYGRDWYDYQPYLAFKSDSEILEEVRDELWWSPFVDENQVEVSVDDGTVTLAGTVDTVGEKRAAVENAYEGGATWVRNELKVKAKGRS